MPNALETHVKQIAAELHALQVCRLYRLSNDLKVAGDQLIYADQQPCDFFGFTASGRAILVECKITAKPTLAVSSKSGLRAHQLRALLEVHRANGLGLLVWQHALEIAVIDIEQVLTYGEGRRSVPWSAVPQRFKKCVVSSPRRFFDPFF